MQLCMYDLCNSEVLRIIMLEKISTGIDGLLNQAGLAEGAIHSQLHII